MNCEYCGFELEEGTHMCLNCGTERNDGADRADRVDQADRIEVLPPEETADAPRESFQELTVIPAHEDERRAGIDYEYQNRADYGPESRGRVYVRHFTLGNTPGGILGKIILGAILLGLVFVALPLALLGIGIFLVLGLLARLRRR